MGGHGRGIIARVDAVKRVAHDGLAQPARRVASSHALLHGGLEVARDMYLLSDLQKHAGHAGVLADRLGVGGGKLRVL